MKLGILTNGENGQTKITKTAKMVFSVASALAAIVSILITGFTFFDDYYVSHSELKKVASPVLKEWYEDQTDKLKQKIKDLEEKQNTQGLTRFEKDLLKQTKKDLNSLEKGKKDLNKFLDN